MIWTLRIPSEDASWTFPLPDGFREGRDDPREGVAFFCPRCAQVWASLLAPGRDTLPLRMACRQHSISHYWPGGSIWMSWDKVYCAGLPPAALLREAGLHLKVLEAEPLEQPRGFSADFSDTSTF